MKKSTKIFAIVLTLALMLGVLVMGISAAGHDYVADNTDPVAGETIEAYIGFEKIAPFDYNGTDYKYLTPEVGKHSPVIVPNNRALPISGVKYL